MLQLESCDYRFLSNMYYHTSLFCFSKCCNVDFPMK